MNAYCDPTWHEGAATPANYFLTGLIYMDEQKDPRDMRLDNSWRAKQFACCADHLERATKYMLESYHKVAVRALT